MVGKGESAVGGEAVEVWLAGERQELQLEAGETIFAYVESRIGTNTDDGIIGGRFSVADIAIGSPFVSMKQGGGELDAARWPKLAGYGSAVHARPSFKALIEEEAASIPA